MANNWFNNIPSTVRVPGVYIEFDNTRSNLGVQVMPRKALMIGQKKAAGTLAVNTIQQVFTLDQVRALAGRGSMLDHMAEAWFAANQYTPLYICVLADNGAGVAATKTVTVATAPTASGTLVLYIGGRRIEVGITAGQTTAQVATAIQTAIAATTDPEMTATVATNVVTLTASHKGEVGNFIDVSTNYYTGEVLPTGLSLTIANGVTGSGNPDIQPALDATGEDWFTDFVCPYTDGSNMTKLETKLGAQFGPLKMQDAWAWTAVQGTFSTIDTFGAARNSVSVHTIGTRNVIDPPWMWAASFGAVASFYFAIDPARPLRTLELVGIRPPAVRSDLFIFSEMNTLLNDGISTWRGTSDGKVILDRVITNYQTNSFGIDDPSYLDASTGQTLAAIRYDRRTYFGQKYGRYKLAKDGTNFSRGNSVMTPSLAESELVARARLYEQLGWLEDFDQYKRDIQVEINPSDPTRLDVIDRPNLVNPLYVIASQIEFIR